MLFSKPGLRGRLDVNHVTALKSGAVLCRRFSFFGIYITVFIDHEMFLCLRTVDGISVDTNRIVLQSLDPVTVAVGHSRLQEFGQTAPGHKLGNRSAFAACNGILESLHMNLFKVTHHRGVIELVNQVSQRGQMFVKGLLKPWFLRALGGRLFSSGGAAER